MNLNNESWQKYRFEFYPGYNADNLVLVGQQAIVQVVDRLERQFLTYNY